MSPHSLSEAADIGTLVIAVAAFFVSWWQTHLQRQTTQLQVFENVFRDIRDQHAHLVHLYAQTNWEQANSEDCRHPFFKDPIAFHEARTAAFGFFNTVEYLALLIRLKVVKRRELFTYFDSMVEQWHEMFQFYLPADNVEVDKFPEFKRMYERVKSRKRNTKPTS